MGSIWEVESSPSVQDYYLVCYFALAFPVARFLLDCFFFQVPDAAYYYLPSTLLSFSARLIPFLPATCQREL